MLDQLDESISDLLAEASTVDPWWCLLVVLVVLSLETSMFIGMVLPGEIALLLAVGALGVRWSVPLFFTAVLANLIGQSGGYWLGRGLGPRLRTSRLGRRLGDRRWRSAEAVLNGSGGRALITTRFVAGVHAIVPAVVGTLRMPFRRFLLLAAVGASLWAGVHTAVAVVLNAVAPLIGYGTLTLLLTCAGACAAGFLLARGHRRRALAKAEQRPNHSVG